MEKILLSMLLRWEMVAAWQLEVKRIMCISWAE
jgi:hypothetical protein